jgi:hypothetical protein
MARTAKSLEERKNPEKVASTKKVGRPRTPAKKVIITIKSRKELPLKRAPDYVVFDETDTDYVVPDENDMVSFEDVKIALKEINKELLDSGEISESSRFLYMDK